MLVVKAGARRLFAEDGDAGAIIRTVRADRYEIAQTRKREKLIRVVRVGCAA